MSNGWKSYFAVFFMLATSLSGCLNEDTSNKTPIIVEAGLPAGTFVTDSTGASIEIDPLEMEFYFSNVGEQGLNPVLALLQADVFSSLHLKNQ